MTRSSWEGREGTRLEEWHRRRAVLPSAPHVFLPAQPDWDQGAQPAVALLRGSPSRLPSLATSGSAPLSQGPAQVLGRKKWPTSQLQPWCWVLREEAVPSLPLEEGMHGTRAMCWSRQSAWRRGETARYPPDLLHLWDGEHLWISKTAWVQRKKPGPHD